MIIAAISDLHGQLPFDNDVVRAADLVVIAGDVCPDSRPIERQADWLHMTFRRWLDELIAEQGIPADRILLTWGNHDFAPERLMTPADLPCQILVDEGLWIDGKYIYLTPWVPNLARWAYSGEGDVPNLHRQAIPPDTDILVSHGPPMSFSDTTGILGIGLGHVGSETLLNRIAMLEIPLTICGHIHEGRGSYDTPWGGRVINVSSLDRAYAPYERRWTIIDTIDRRGWSQASTSNRRCYCNACYSRRRVNGEE